MLVINDRPDGEDAEQPGSAAEADAAQDAGIAYRHIPVTAATLSEADIRSFQSAVTGAGGPVLAHCKTGTRSLTLWVLGEVLDGRMTAADIIPFGKRFGFDLTSAALWLAKRDGEGTVMQLVQSATAIRRPRDLGRSRTAVHRENDDGREIAVGLSRTMARLLFASGGFHARMHERVSCLQQDA